MAMKYLPDLFCHDTIFISPISGKDLTAYFGRVNGAITLDREVMTPGWLTAMAALGRLPVRFIIALGICPVILKVLIGSVQLVERALQHLESLV
jgi:hypothetical protein